MAQLACSVQNPRPFISLEVTFDQLTCHLHTNAEHGFGHFYMLPLKKCLGIFGEIQGNQRTLVLGTAQFDPAIRQFDNF